MFTIVIIKYKYLNHLFFFKKYSIILIFIYKQFINQCK